MELRERGGTTGWAYRPDWIQELARRGCTELGHLTVDLPNPVSPDRPDRSRTALHRHEKRHLPPQQGWPEGCVHNRGAQIALYAVSPQARLTARSTSDLVALTGRLNRLPRMTTTGTDHAAEPAVSMEPADPAGLPVPEEDPRRRVRFILVVVAIVVALALIVGAVWVAGGFKERTDRFTTLEPGTTFTTGPYELAFSKITVQYHRERKVYDIIVLGTGRTTADKGPPIYLPDKMMFLLDPKSSGFAEDGLEHYGTSEDSMVQRDTFTPGQPTIPFSAEYSMPTEPSKEMVFVVWDLEFGDTSIMQDQDPVWSPSRDAYRFVLPTERLPDLDY